jgi:hypothetical protein
MTTLTLTLDTRFYLETRSGGRVRFQAERIGLVELIMTMIMFLVSVAMRVIEIESHGRPSYPPRRRAVATKRGIFAVWSWAWLRGVFGGGGL